MDKLKSIGIVLAFVFVAYILLTVIMPIFTTGTDAAADAMEGSAYASDYAASVAGADYVPLVVYFMPAVAGILAVYRILREKWL